MLLVSLRSIQMEATFLVLQFIDNVYRIPIDSKHSTIDVRESLPYSNGSYFSCITIY
jgi:hypothetical protein